MPQGKLFLIPNVLAENTADAVITPQVKEVIAHTKVFLVENLRTARRYISSLKLGVNLEEVHMEILDKNTTPESINRLLQPLFKGADVGIISEAGCPGIADPGALAVDSGGSTIRAKFHVFGLDGLWFFRSVIRFSRILTHRQKRKKSGSEKTGSRVSKRA